MYTTVAPILGLPNDRQARKVRAKETSKQRYLPGINDWAIELVATRESLTMSNSKQYGWHSCNTVLRIIELYLDHFLVGREFSPDVRCWPSPDELDVAIDWEQIKQYVMKVRHNKSYAPEAYSFHLCDTSGKLADQLIGSIPQAHSGITGCHMVLLVEKKARLH